MGSKDIWETITNTYQDIYLLDFYERKEKEISLIDYKELLSLNNHYNKISRELSKDIENILKEHYLPIYEILTLCKGKVSLCGMSVIELITGTFSVGKFNLYFYCCDQEYIENILSQLNDKIFYYDNFIVVCGSNRFFIEISDTIYKDKEELLRNVGNTPIKHGYNLIDGYFSSIPAALSLVTSIFPLDINLNHQNICNCNIKGILPMFHGNNKNILPEWHLFVPIFNLKGETMYRLDGIQVCDGDIPCGKLVQSTDKTKFKLFIDIPYKRFDPKIRFGKDYIPIIIGIDDDRYVALSNIRRQYNLNDDIFHLLCRYWYLQEVFDAKSRLLKK